MYLPQGNPQEEYYLIVVPSIKGSDQYQVGVLSLRRPEDLRSQQTSHISV